MEGMIDKRIYFEIFIYSILVVNFVIFNAFIFQLIFLLIQYHLLNLSSF